ncbi:putative clathrin assembly protein At2g01600 [Bidens hawaiensis]|uniref:putative clathrin assembly protein At2g01600 n=1 Tax=Bidens hawaiensis TaxID=980011 RepID=UPI004049FEBC
MAAMLTWRRAYGALKDQTKVGLARVNSDFKEVDVAIVKATNHVECPPKERHIRKILAATSVIRPQADVQYSLHALTRRLAKTRNWTVALKTLIVIHRVLRESDSTFREELMNFQQRGRVLQLATFKDDSSSIAWDCSAWVRTYGLFLEERLECFKVLKYDIESENIPRSAKGEDKGYSRTRDLDCEKLLEQLPSLQQLLNRLMACRPEGGAVGNYVVQYALALVLKESFKIYCAINDGIINLVDKFFEMPRHEAIKALDIYKQASNQAESLSDFYEICKRLQLARNFQFPVLREPPQSFLVTMEEYISEAPRMVPVSTDALEYPERLMLTYKPEENNEPTEDATSPNETKLVPIDNIVVSNDNPTPDPAPSPPTFNSHEPDDLLGLTFNAPSASSVEESNALALALVQTDATSNGSAGVQAKDIDLTGWELALVTSPSTDISSFQERQLGGGLDSLTLNNLYDEGAYKAAQQPVYGSPAPNPFEVSDPFVANPPTANPFGSSQPQHNQMMVPPNPFIDSGFGVLPVDSTHTQPANPFETGLL